MRAAAASVSAEVGGWCLNDVFGAGIHDRISHSGRSNGLQAAAHDGPALLTRPCPKSKRSGLRVICGKRGGRGGDGGWGVVLCGDGRWIGCGRLRQEWRGVWRRGLAKDGGYGRGPLLALKLLDLLHDADQHFLNRGILEAAKVS